MPTKVSGGPVSASDAVHDATPERSDVTVDAVIVAFNSARTLAGSVAPLAALDWVRVTVVDNASPDRSLAAVAHLPIDAVKATSNAGFAAGCNIGIARGSARYVLLLNPDARLAPADLRVLVDVLDREPGAAIAAPRLYAADGTLAASQFRFPRRRSTFGRALLMHRIWPHANWTDELVREPDAYLRAGSPEWVSGACMLVRRAALEQIGPLDEGFFLYCEDTDLCERVRASGWDIRFEPGSSAYHEGGVSGPRHALLPVHAHGRVSYARKHDGQASAIVEAGGVMLGHALHAAIGVRDPVARRAHLRALGAAARATSSRAHVPVPNSRTAPRANLTARLASSAARGIRIAGMQLAPAPRMKQRAWRQAEQLACRLGAYRPAHRTYQLVFNRERYRADARSRDFFREFVRDGALVFDIGANEGRTSELFAELGARVIAVEPNPALARRIRARHGSAGVTVEELAVGAEPGSATLHLGVYNGHSTLSTAWLNTADGDHGAGQRWDGSVEVTVTTVDELVARHGRPAFMKIDVEGFESDVLAGMSEPVQALSFEFLCAAPAIAEACLERLRELGEYEFNFAVGEQKAMRLDTWTKAGQILAQLEAFSQQSPGAYGDVYARRKVA